MDPMTDLGIPGVGDATLIASGGSALVYKALSGTGEALAVKVLRGMRGAEVAPHHSHSPRWYHHRG